MLRWHFLHFHLSLKTLVPALNIWKINGNMKSGDKQIHTFMFSSLLVAVTCVFFKIVFGHIYAPNQFEFFVELLSKIQYAHYKTQWKTYLFLQFQLSTLYIHKDPIFDVTTITVFSRSLHNANSPLFLHFTFTVLQYLLVHKRSRFKWSCVSRDSSWSRPFKFWVLRISTVTWTCRAHVLLHTVAWAF